MQLKVLLPKTHYTAGEHRTALLILRNESHVPLEFPDPLHAPEQALRYTLTGPVFPESRHIPCREVSSRGLSHVLASRPGARVRLAPGQTFESLIALHDWLPVTRPGRYRLEASLTHPDFSITSPPVEFDILAPPTGPVSLACDVAAPDGSGVEATWLQDVEGRPSLLVRGYEEPREDTSRPPSPRQPASVIGPVAPGITEALAPWSNDPDRISSVSWRVWRQGASLMALAGPATPGRPFRFDLEAPPAQVVRPPLQTAAGELFIPVVAACGRELRLICFQTSSDASDLTPGWEMGRVGLHGRIVAARATLQPASRGNGVSVVLVEQTDRGLDLHHVRTHGSGRFTRVATTRLKGLHALPDSEPGIWVDEAGRLHAALLTLSRKNPRQVVLAEVHHRPDGRPAAKPRLTALRELPCAPRAAVARHHPERSRAGVLTWAILLENGSLLTPHTVGAPMRPRHPVGLPLELFPARRTYVLTWDPVQGPAFEALR
ncbi:hypothetical protein LZ198_31330 [Myxococcus sp. K15C18031901]|uniref:hypothetical protein n=1 Tax=Myxococcus dinghuensis TaxID=2906761 RepID=UPI0020A81EF2|nr:hypothetical protein [Myxococcus dinghuensis]MCP3103385.1 hypothetical protein [Myxococcus dinghuensis]